MPMAPEQKQKIAILGGGMAALTAAFELTRSRERAERYEITVYQVGHRLGGKGASGRNRQESHRIEEHGLHILMGFYENTFKLLRDCYEELGRRPGEPLATVDEAFLPHSFIALAEEVDGKWDQWPLPFPPLPGKPGEGHVELPSPPEAIRQMLSWMRSLVANSRDLRPFTPHFDAYMMEITRRLCPPQTSMPRGNGEAAPLPPAPEEELAKLEALLDEILESERQAIVGSDPLRAPRIHIPAFAFLELSCRLSQFAVADAWSRLSALLGRFRRWLSDEIAAKVEKNTALRRAFIFLDLGITAVLGLHADGALSPPYDFFALDDLDLQEWLGKHGAHPISRDSTLIRGVYNLLFTAPKGLAAGTALHGILRMVYTYRGAIFYRMQAGMGDAVFAPLYLVLKQRGVKFQFFHRVDNLELSPDKKSIASIQMGRQATPKNGDYNPLYDVDGLPCWPSTPNYDELEEGEALQTCGEDLECFWTAWPDVEKKCLSASRDFDKVILGISVGAFPHICKELIAESEPFRAMVESVKTTQTQAAQLWLGSSFEALGWQREPSVLDGFAGPFDTWADMTHLLKREKWAGDDKPVALAYLCGRLDDKGPLPPQSYALYPRDEASRVKENAIEWLTTHAGGLWPGAIKGGSFDWSALIDPKKRAGVARLESQYTRATFCPSERYVLSVPGSTRCRLRAEESGFERLVLAGDWVKTSLSSGCVEAATMAGLQASRAICGYPEVIVGDLPQASESERPPPVKPAQKGLAASPSGPNGALDLPPYVERPGELVIPQPLSLQGTTSYSFFLPADEERLRALCDRLLNGPAGGAAHYVPAGPFVMLLCADITHAQACEAPHSDIGWVPERDIALWVPLLAGKLEGGSFSADRLVWLLTYTFVDNTAAVITGREIYGFPKAQAVLRFPSDEGAGGVFSVDTLVIKERGPKTRGEIARLITVESTAPKGVAEEATAWPNLGEGFRKLGAQVIDGILGGVGKALAPAAAFAQKLVEGHRDLTVTMVFLKQFRDVRDPSRACYQAVVEAPAVVDAWHSGGFLPPHRVTIAKAASHPIVEELGLPGATVEGSLGVWLTYDFTVGRGVILGGRG